MLEVIRGLARSTRRPAHRQREKQIMKRFVPSALTPVLVAALASYALLSSIGCGSKPPKTADDEATTDTSSSPPSDPTPEPTSKASAPGSGDDSAAKGGGNPCAGFEMDLMAALNMSACEVSDVKPDSKPKDVKGTLTVTATADSARVAHGGHADILVTYANKSAAPLVLDFTVDPTPRFSVEVYGAKTNKRAEMPTAPQPKLPAGSPPLEPGEAKVARVTIAANGKATVHIPWDAVKTRWAPEKLKGTPPEMGYPRVPAGPLAKGKYNLRVVTPLTNVFEGIDHEVSAPRTSIEVQ
jgi:hypothetical protein